MLLPTRHLSPPTPVPQLALMGTSRERVRVPGVGRGREREAGREDGQKRGGGDGR